MTRQLPTQGWQHEIDEKRSVISYEKSRPKYIRSE